MPTRYNKQFNSYTIGLNGTTTGRAAYITCQMDGRFAGRMDFYAEGTAVPNDFVWNIPAGPVPVLALPGSPPQRGAPDHRGAGG